MIKGKAFYDVLPVWGQNLAVGVASARNFKQKYGRAFHKALDRLALNERMSKDQMLDMQHSAVRRLLTYVCKHVPYYRELERSPDDLASWPILEKAQVVARPEQFVSEEFRTDDLMDLKTSGTTGTPLTVLISRDYHQVEMAFRWRHKAWGGVPFLSTGAYVSGHPVVPANQTRPPFWRIDPVEKRLLCSSYHLSPDNLPSYLEALARYAPDFVHGYPSSLYVLARYMLERGIGEPHPKAVFTASETLLAFQRTVIEQAFGARVFNWYGNTEMTCNIVQCAAGELHYRLDYGVLELLDDGRMVCTGLNNFAMPFIRYRTGDVATAREGACPCGCAFPLIERIEGRVEDYIQTLEGRLIGRLDHLFKDVHHVREAQIVQRRIDELILRIVPLDGYSDQDEQVVVREARNRLGETMRVRFEYVESIPRTANGKFRFVVSEMPG